MSNNKNKTVALLDPTLREARARRQLRKIQGKNRLSEMAKQIPSKRTDAEFGSAERVDWHIDNWAAWMRWGERQGAYGAVAIGLSDGGASQHFEDMVAKEDIRCAKVMHEIVCELPEAQRIAVYVHADLLPAAFRFRGDALGRAKASIGSSLKARGMW